jgi:hypothetical protein
VVAVLAVLALVVAVLAVLALVVAVLAVLALVVAVLAVLAPVVAVLAVLKLYCLTIELILQSDWSIRGQYEYCRAIDYHGYNKLC